MSIPQKVGKDPSIQPLKFEFNEILRKNLTKCNRPRKIKDPRIQIKGHLNTIARHTQSQNSRVNETEIDNSHSQHQIDKAQSCFQEKTWSNETTIFYQKAKAQWIQDLPHFQEVQWKWDFIHTHKGINTRNTWFKDQHQDVNHEVLTTNFPMKTQ